MAADIWTLTLSADSPLYLTGYAVVAIDGRIGTIDDRSLHDDHTRREICAGLQAGRALQRLGPVQRLLRQLLS